MESLTVQSLKKYPSLIPLYACVALGFTGAAIFALRTATRSPEVSWFRRSNPEPWRKYENKQYKLYSPFRDYSQTKAVWPEY